MNRRRQAAAELAEVRSVIARLAAEWRIGGAGAPEDFAALVVGIVLGVVPLETAHQALAFMADLSAEDAGVLQ